ncbi:unnamed protein product [Clonostachys chloroleuca]|uniref:ARS-binding protein 2 n=1 Tax=Clonostachys chloroleuca TaxID=1926264 RepID=A0AA35QAM8_9HYPO|nr:unnamed protein product [Clonostachys chloroleuca]
MPSLSGQAQQQQQQHALAPAHGAEQGGAVSESNRGLPDRTVTAATLEDAYVKFIFYCNPAVPADQDTQALRDAFSNPPKSAGKSFETFTVYHLVLQFLRKEIKTWTELTIKLGVEPPDPKKDESAQKVTQYGVRLKKWMNSLHIKAFFDYLRGVENEYWTAIPGDPDPTSQQVRDGVALEDDMALRALLPQIRPRRGRKRPDESDGPGSAAQKMRLSPSFLGENLGDPQLLGYVDGARSAHPVLGKNDGSQTPFSQWPTSAVTPTVRGSFWDDALEPQSATTPSQLKPGRQRRGAKNVSSAWKAGGAEGGGKARGRPPINRTPIEGPGFHFQPWLPAKPGSNLAASPITESNQESPPSQVPAVAVVTPSPTPQPPSQQFSTTADTSPARPPVRPPVRSSSEHSRPARPVISLKVPERSGGPIRLATPPPPVVVVNGEVAGDPTTESNKTIESQAPRFIETTMKTTEKSDTESQGARAVEKPVGDYYFERMEDRTNVDSLMEYFLQAAQEGIWLDQHGNPDDVASVGEASAIINSIMQNMINAATDTASFLLNLSVLAGARALKAKPVKCTRLADGKDCYNYKFEWEYRFGHLVGQVAMEHNVSKSMWRRPGSSSPEDGAVGMNGLSAEEWQRKYEVLLQRMKQKDEELSDLQAKTMATPEKEA